MSAIKLRAHGEILIGSKSPTVYKLWDTLFSVLS